jgi:transcriptional regulator with XRE-family HTH domain
MLQVTLNLVPIYQFLLVSLISLFMLLRWYLNLARLRTKFVHMTQEQLAEKLNVSDRTVRRWEAGSAKPALSSLNAYAELLDDLKLATEATEIWAEILEDLGKRIDDIEGQTQ